MSSSQDLSINGAIIQDSKKRKTVVLLECKICGNPTAESHYNVTSVCNADKIFFRRYVIKGVFKCCIDSNNCSKKQAVSKCRPCRYALCLKAGMKPEEVFKRRDERARHLKISYDRKPKAESLNDTTDETEIKIVEDKETIKVEHEDSLEIDDPFPTESCQTVVKLMDKSYFSIKNNYIKEINKMLYIEKCFQLVRNHTFTVKMTFNLSIYHLFTKPSSLGMLRKIENYDESHIISKDTLYCHRLHDSLCLVVNYAKTLNFFQKLDLRDKKELMRSIASTLILVDNSYYSFYHGYLTLHCPDHYEPIREFNPPRPLDKIVCCDFVSMFHTIKLTPEEFCFFRVLVFCEYSPPAMTHRGKEILREERIYQSKSLLSYEKMSLGVLNGTSRYNEILFSVKEAYRYGNKLNEYNTLQHIIVKNTKDTTNMQMLPVTKYLMPV